MSDGTQHDAAFGPMGDAPGMGTVVTPPPTPLEELQGLLNLRGYGPVVVNGQWDAPTQNAARAAGMTVSAGAPTAEQLQQAITLLRAPNPSTASPVDAPWYKQPKYLLMVAAGLGVVGYIAWRAGAFEEAGEEEPKDAEGVSGAPAPRKRARNLPPVKEKCSIVPDVEGATPIPPPEGA